MRKTEESKALVNLIVMLVLAAFGIWSIYEIVVRVLEVL